MGIKSFMGKRSKVVAEEVNIKVSDYMTTKLITFTPDQSVMDVMQKLIKFVNWFVNWLRVAELVRQSPFHCLDPT